jgi:Peptidase A4 family
MFSKRLLVTTALTVTALLGAFGITSLPAAASIPSAENVPNPGGPIVRAPDSGGSSVPTISFNWSGYAAVSSKKFTFVHARFVQPSITCTGNKSQWTSDWAGLDGFTTGTVEQDGTFAHCGGKNGTTPEYEAWYELFPAPSVNVFNVRPGDTIDASVRYANGKFTLVISDLTLGRSATHTAGCSDCARASAEWIIERPALCNNTETKCYLTELADFHTSTVGQDQAQVAGGKVTGAGGFSNIPIFMVTPLHKGFISLDTVGALSSSGEAFTAVWDRPGSTVPISL